MGLQLVCKPIFAGCDMKEKQATYLEIASLCRELALLLHAGVRAGDGLALLAEEETEARRRKQLEAMAHQVDDGVSLGEALESQGLFPAYAGGEYGLDGTVFLVSRGLARESTRIPRIFNRPEVVIADIVPENR